MAAAEAETARPILLPQPERLTLRNFSLYSRRRSVEVAFDREVFCLAGANGLGKSTFLSALSYAMTGVVARPGVTFLGASDYYDDLVDYSSRYFDGRINADDRDIAEVELELTVGDQHVRLARGMFDPQGLRRLEILGPDGASDYSGPELTDAQRHRLYVDVVCEASGLADFAQFVFLQLVVFTFGEERRLMFWTPRVTEQALFLAFGVSADVASKAEALQRAFDSAESRARNLQWQATGRRKRLEALDAAVAADSADVDEPDPRAEHVRLSRALDQAGESLTDATSARAEAEVTLNDVTARLLAAQGRYEQVYSDRLVASRSAHLHPAVVGAINDHACGVCGASGAAISNSVQGALDRHQCPLCASALEEVDPAELAAARAELHILGEQIVELERTEAVARADLQRRRDAIAGEDSRIRTLSRDLEDFRRANSNALLRASGEDGLIEGASRGLQAEINDLLEQKDAELSRRDAAQAGLDELRDELTSRFADMEHEFVPILQELAYEFLGVPLQVDLQRRGPRLELALSFAGTQRRRPEALSESQRFFVDIALRMALARKLAQTGRPATLYVDTPEGSLDIAYEMRAGRMFARFARGAGGVPNRLVMTANINTSQLLHQLAADCGRDRMELLRMTEWTELSDVQQEAAGAFEDAYSSIEQALETGVA